VATDAAKAVALFSKAADQGNVDAQLLLGILTVS
jgi:TPR repeat protein